MRPWRTILIYAVLLGGTVVLAFPLWWMLVIALSTEAEAAAAMGTASAFRLWPEEAQWHNFPDALRELGAATAAQATVPGNEAAGAADGHSIRRWYGFFDALSNTIVITTLCVIGQIAACSLVGFAFARMRFRGRGPMFVVMLATMMLPVQVTMIPLFLLFRTVGWIDTILPLVVPSFFGTAFFIFMFRQFFTQVPEDLLDAARIDGASNFGIWWRIMLPMCRPVVAITAIYTFIWTWNDFMGPLIYLFHPENYTLALALNSFKSQFGGLEDAHLLMAASVMTMVPCVVLFFVAQRHFVRGLNLGAVKG